MKEKTLDPLAFVTLTDVTKRALSEYGRSQAKIFDLQNQIASIDARLTSCTSHISAAPAHGGPGSEHRMEALAAKKADLEAELDKASEIVVAVNRALDELSRDERRILEIADVRRRASRVWAIQAQDELHMSQASVYRLHNKAIASLGMRLFDPKSAGEIRQ